MPRSAQPRSSKGERSPATVPWDFPDPRVSADERGAWFATVLSLLFLLAALLALALVPAYLNQQVAQVQERIQDVLGPAEQLAAEIELAQTKRLAAVEAFLYSGNPDLRQAYREALAEENRLYETLRLLTEGLDLTILLSEGLDQTIWQMTQRIRDRSFSWDLGLQSVLNEEVSLEEFLQSWSTERARFDDVVLATRTLRDALAVETRLQLSEMARRRDAQTLISRILIFGLLAPLAVLFSIGWRLRSVMRESESFRRAATRARREADALLAATGDGVLGMDRDGRCRYLNRAGAELLGYPARAVVGKDVHELLHHTRAEGTPHPREECVVLKALETGIPVSGRNEILWTAGNFSFPVQISVRPLKDGGAIRGAVLTFTDMTETRAAEESLRQAIQARDEVLAVVSHDLRNPVGTIFSSASLLLELNLSEERQREQFMAVKRAAGRMNRLIQDLLDVARLEAGALRIASGHFQFGELLDEVISTHREGARLRGVHLRSRSPDPYSQGWGDRDRIHQVLSNLVENALKFSPAGGSVEVGAREEPEEHAALFWVSDTGPGIDEEDRERLFERFWQVRRRDKRGAGLGLSIVKGLVEAHGGRVWVESEEGVGSTFLFLLPHRTLETQEEPHPTIGTGP